MGWLGIPKDLLLQAQRCEDGLAWHAQIYCCRLVRTDVGLMLGIYGIPRADTTWEIGMKEKFF